MLQDELPCNIKRGTGVKIHSPVPLLYFVYKIIYEIQSYE